VRRSRVKKEDTIRLYFDDSYRREFEARVLERWRGKGKPVLVLDQTCFYPESGGQPSDEGWINGVKVDDVKETEGKILHVLGNDVSSDKVSGKINWKTRFDNMQQHSGQHILSQSFHELFSAETLSFHLGKVFSTVEIDLRRISEEEVEKIESLANEVVFQDREIKTYFISEEEIRDIPLRKPPAKKGLIRVVEVSGFDYSACGGTHVSRTGEIGLIKILKWERIRNNVRFEFVCGRRTLEDYTWKNRSVRDVSTRFTVHECEILPYVDKLFSDLKFQKRMNRKIQEKISQYQAQEMIQQTTGQLIKEIFTDKTPEEVRSLALNIMKKGEFIILFGLKREERGHLVLACSESLKLDMREIVPIVSPLIEGKGGGRSSMVEISGMEIRNIELALNKASEYIEKKLS